MFSEKPLEWAGAAKRDLMDFPDEVRRAVGYALGVAQLGLKHPSAKPWKGEGTGVLEVVESFEGNAYRAVYTVRFAKAVYVLHCFQKKSPSGIRTAKTDIDLVHQRLKAAEQHYEEHYA
jgi:phage-related protein